MGVDTKWLAKQQEARMSDDLKRRLRDVAEFEGLRVAEEAVVRIEELEAKLEKAVDFIEDLTGCEWPYDEGAKRILAELTSSEAANGEAKGGKDE